MARVSLAAIRERVEAVPARASAGSVEPWFGELRFFDEVVTVAVPWLREAYAYDMDAEPCGHWKLPDDITPTAHHWLQIVVTPALTVIAERSLFSHGGDLYTQLYLYRAGERPVLLEPEGLEHEMCWAVSPGGRTVVTTDVDDERSRLFVCVRAPDGRELRRFDLVDTDDGDDAVLWIDDDASRCFATGDGLVELELGKRTRTRARWAIHGALSWLRPATRVGRVLGVERGERGIVWIMRGPKQKHPVIGAGLSIPGPVECLGIAPDERYAYWLARRADGAAAVLRLGLEDGVTELAELPFVEAVHPHRKGLWAPLALDPSCTRLAVVRGDELAIEPFAPSWGPLPAT